MANAFVQIFNAVRLDRYWAIIFVHSVLFAYLANVLKFLF